MPLLPPSGHNNNQSGPRNSNNSFLAQIPQGQGPAQQRDEKLLRNIHKKIDELETLPEANKIILKNFITYLMTGFKEGVKDTIDFLRREPGYSIESLCEPREFQAIDSDDYSQIHTTRLEPNPNNENEFEIIEADINCSDNEETLSYRAKIQIDPQQENFAYIKELSVRFKGELIFATEEDPTTNHKGVPDVTLTLDLSPQNTQS